MSKSTDEHAAQEAAKLLDRITRTEEGRLTVRERIGDWFIALLFEKIARVYWLMAGVAIIVLVHDKVLGLILGFVCLYMYDFRITSEEMHRTFERGQSRYKYEQSQKNEE